MAIIIARGPVPPNQRITYRFIRAGIEPNVYWQAGGGETTEPERAQTLDYEMMLPALRQLGSGWHAEQIHVPDPCYGLLAYSIGNPDFGQNPNGPRSEPEELSADTLEELAAKCQAYITKWGLGGGNWPNPVIYDLHNGEAVIGYISYNGRIWLYGTPV